MNRSTFLRLLSSFLLLASFTAVPAAETKDPVVVLKTSMGTITLQLDAQHAPLSTANFLQYVDSKFYDGTVFHRIIPGFMVQGGGFTPDMAEKPTQTPIHNESTNGLKNVRGSISMARTSDPDSATSQFFLNLVDNTDLDSPPGGGPGYAVFGKIIGGLDVIDKMAQVPTASVGQNENVPVKPVMLISARRKS